jgi:hypothetical protein
VRAIRIVIITMFLLGIATLTLMAVQVFDDQEIDNLAVSMRMPASLHTFDPESLAALPPPARRWLTRAIAPGAHVAATVELRMSGEIREPGDETWKQFEAIEVLSPRRGFLWRANAWDGPFGLRIAEHYIDGSGRQRLALWGLIPLGTDDSGDVQRSARERLALEAIWVPSTLLPGASVRWEAIDDVRVRAVVRLGEHDHALVLAVAQDGSLEGVVSERWGRSADGTWGSLPYGLAVEEEQTFGDYTIATRLRGGWSFGVGDAEESIRVQVSEARFLPVEDPAKAKAAGAPATAGESASADGGE